MKELNNIFPKDKEQKKSFIIRHIIISACIFIIYAQISMIQHGVIFPTVPMIVCSLMFMLISGVYNDIQALRTYIGVYVLVLLFSMPYSINMFAFIPGTLVVYKLASNIYYSSLKKTIRAGVYLFIFVLGGNLYVYFLTKPTYLVQVSPAIIFNPIILSAIESFLATLILYLYYSKAPSKVRRFFFTGNKRMMLSMLVKESGNKLSSKMARMFAVIALFGLLASISAAHFMVGSLLSAARVHFSALDFIVFDLQLLTIILNVVIIVIVYANYLAQKNITNPIISLSREMNQFTIHTPANRMAYVNKIASLNIRTGDEIEVLYEAIKNTVFEASSYIDWFEKKQQLENEVNIANAANLAKSTFLSQMSHEIRTPLNTVLGMNELILRDSNDEKTLEYAENIRISGQTLLGLLNDILDFSKIESGKLEILEVEYDLGPLIQDLGRMLKDSAREKGLSLKISLNENAPSILYGDEIRIKQIVLNLLTNALKYTEKGIITLSADFEWDKTDGDFVYLYFSVSDTGIGIKEEEIKLLTSPFTRLDEKRNRTIEGTGLGLTIVKSLLDLMGSHLEVQSTYGEGSEFSFKIRQKVINKRSIGDISSRLEYEGGKRTKAKRSFLAPNARLLFVDDTPINLIFIKELLAPTQMDITTAESGYEMLDLIKKERYDIIFIDHRMPNMDGIDALKAMRALPENICKNTFTPCIALTANAVSGAREMYFNAGFDGYLSKPVDSSKLEDLILHFLPAEKIKLSSAKEALKEPEVPGYFLHFSNIDGINPDDALANCENYDILRDLLKNLCDTARGRCDTIEEAFENEDFENYAIQVHALKSSLRLIGANELSYYAAYLEQCGEEENLLMIAARTPILIEKFLTMCKKIKRAIE